MKLNERLISLFCLINVVYAVAVWRESVRHFQFALAYRHAQRRCVRPVFLCIFYCFLPLGERGIKHNVVRAGCCERIFGVLFISCKIRFGLSLHHESPFVVGRIAVGVLSVGVETACKWRRALHVGVLFLTAVCHIYGCRRYRRHLFLCDGFIVYGRQKEDDRIEKYFYIHAYT